MLFIILFYNLFISSFFIRCDIFLLKRHKILNTYMQFLCECMKIDCDARGRHLKSCLGHQITQGRYCSRGQCLWTGRLGWWSLYSKWGTGVCVPTIRGSHSSSSLGKSIPSAGCLRVYGSLPVQSTCVLWTWRRHLPVSLVAFFGWCSAKGCTVPVRPEQEFGSHCQQ